LWNVGLFPAEFINRSRQFSHLFGGEDYYRSAFAAVSTKRLISIAYTEFSRMDPEVDRNTILFDCSNEELWIIAVSGDTEVFFATEVPKDNIEDARESVLMNC
jgi:hypothetical protein